MTPAEILQRECAEMEKKGKIFTTPYRMDQLLKTASRITSIITSSHTCTLAHLHTCMNYHEMTLILRIVFATIRETIGEEIDE